MANAQKTKAQPADEVESLRRRVRELEAVNARLDQQVAEQTAALARADARFLQERRERERVEDALRHRAEFETLIALLSKHFLNLSPQEIDEGITYALRVIGEFAGVDRSYLFLFADEKKTRLDNTHEWCAEGIPPQRQHLQGVPVEAIPWWMRQLHQLQTIHIPRVADLPREAAAEKALLRAQGIRSLIVVPLTSGGTLSGFLGFDAVREEKAWRPESARLLTIVGEIFAHVLARRQTDKTLQEREEQFRQLAENIREVFWMSVPGMSQLLYVSPAYEEIWGRTCESLRAEPRVWLETIHPEDREFARAALEKQRHGELTDAEYRIVRPDGAVRWIRDRSFPVRNAQGEVYRVVGVAEDVTERRRAEESLREAKEAAEAANRAKTEFLATMSHELRTPLHIVLGYTDLVLEEEFGALSDKQKNVLRRVRKNARVLQDLITAVLELSRLEAGQLPVNRRKVQVAPLLAEVEVELQDLLEQSGLVYASSLADPLPALYTDPDKLKVVLKNLIGNAVKFTERGNITVAARTREEGVEVSVTDTGIGIPAEMLARIFEPFYQGDSSSTRPYGGAGLGLYIVKRLLELLEGTVTVESQVGRGSTFRIWLPASAGLRVPVFDLRRGQWVLRVKG
ncbi:MAG: ATP-binding protein [Thermodesulfobacteriota bacterium]